MIDPSEIEIKQITIEDGWKETSKVKHYVPVEQVSKIIQSVRTNTILKEKDYDPKVSELDKRWIQKSNELSKLN